MRAFPSPEEAAYHFAWSFQETTACVTDARFNYPASITLNKTQSLILAGGDDVVVGSGFYIYASHWFVVTDVKDGFVVRTGGYMYTINTDDLGGELASWHWHPDRESWCKSTHIHIRGEPGDHLPSGRVALEEIVCWLILQAEVPALRPNWAEVLDRNEEDWVSRRSWA